MIKTFSEPFFFSNRENCFSPQTTQVKDTSLQIELCFIKYIWKHVTAISNHLETAYKVNTPIFSIKQEHLALNSLTTHFFQNLSGYSRDKNPNTCQRSYRPCECISHFIPSQQERRSSKSWYVTLNKGLQWIY